MVIEEKAKKPTRKQLLQERQKMMPGVDNMEMPILPGFKRFVNVGVKPAVWQSV